MNVLKSKQNDDCVILILYFSHHFFFVSSQNFIKYNMGKVHGSLARAGKVKGQTPKAEKQEDKKKQPRGRAKKRMQYNRRYVNVVTGMGGKKVGPNSNADKM
jgi:small subunit ribosomal protein S30e